MDGVSASAANFNKTSPTSNRQDQESGDFFARLMNNDSATRTSDLSVARARKSDTRLTPSEDVTHGAANDVFPPPAPADTASPTHFDALFLVPGAIQNAPPRPTEISSAGLAATSTPSAPTPAPASTSAAAASTPPVAGPATSQSQSQSGAPTAEELAQALKAAQQTAGNASEAANAAAKLKATTSDTSGAPTTLSSAQASAQASTQASAMTSALANTQANAKNNDAASATPSGNRTNLTDSMSQYLSDQSKQSGAQNTSSAASGAQQSHAKSNDGGSSPPQASGQVSGQASGGQPPALPAQTLNAPGDPLSMMADAAPDMTATDAPETPGAPSQSSAPAAMRNASPSVFQAWNNVIQRFDGKSQRFEIRLDPAELGEIDVTIDITEDNKARVVLAARHPEALAELTRGARTLELALSEAGIDLKEDGLTFELSQKEQNESSSFTFADDHESQAEKDALAEAQLDASDTTDEVVAVQELTPQLSIWNRLHVNIRA